MTNKYHIVSFSGGKDSTAMLIRMLELNMRVDEIIFVDTQMEFPTMYQHIEQVQQYINRGITVLTSEKDYLYWMFDHEKTRGKNKGKKGYMWMDSRSRWCTSQLKQQPIWQYYKTLEAQGYEIIEYHGIAYDEQTRTQNNQANPRTIKYPLVEWKWTEQDALQYCYEKGFDWGGLYHHFNRLSCYLCPLQRLNELEIIYRHYPELWQYMRQLDEKNKELYQRKFRSDYSILQLEDKFEGRPIRQEEVDFYMYLYTYSIEPLDATLTHGDIKLKPCQKYPVVLSAVLDTTSQTSLQYNKTIHLKKGSRFTGRYSLFIDPLGDYRHYNLQWINHIPCTKMITEPKWTTRGVEIQYQVLDDIRIDVKQPHASISFR